MGRQSVKNNIVKRSFEFLTPVALVLGCMAMIVPVHAGAASPVRVKKEVVGNETGKKQVWTVTEAEIARQAAEGVPLKNIINGAVKSKQRIHVVIAAAIKVGIDPSRVVYSAITEGYADQTVVTAAVKAGAPLGVVVKSAANAGVDKGALNIGELVTMAIKGGEDLSSVVSGAITEGFSAQAVVKAALIADAPLDLVVKSATGAGADDKSIYVGAADAGESPRDVERAILAARTPATPETTIKTIVTPPSAENLPFVISPPAPALFGRGGVILTPMPVLSPLNLHAGGLKVNPFISLSQTFSDNATYVPADAKQSDSITAIMPGVRLQLPFQAHSADMQYYSVVSRYEKFTEENTIDHHLSAAVDFKVKDRYELKFSDRFEAGHEPLSSSPTGSTEEFKTNTAAFMAAYLPAESVKVQLDYGRSSWRFDTSDFRDREEDQLAGTVFYRVLPGTSVFIEYDLKNIAYAEDTLGLDSTVGALQAGLTWDISARSKGTVKAGIARKDFSSSTRNGGTVKVGSADVRHAFSTGTTVVLTAERSMNEPNLPDIAYFMTTGAYAELTQRFLKKWAVVLRGAFVQDLYFIRTDRTALSGAGLKYQAKDWLELAVDYNLRERNSTIPANKYEEHSSIILMNVSL